MNAVLHLGHADAPTGYSSADPPSAFTYLQTQLLAANLPTAGSFDTGCTAAPTAAPPYSQSPTPRPIPASTSFWPPQGSVTTSPAAHTASSQLKKPYYTKREPGPRSPKPRCPWRGRGSVLYHCQFRLCLNLFLHGICNLSNNCFFLASIRTAFSLVQNV